MIEIEKLVWEDYNIEHIARHNVTPQEVEEVCAGDFILKESQQGRLLITGPDSTGNLLTVVLGPEDDNEWYVVTARPAAKKERREYQRAKGVERNE